MRIVYFASAGTSDPTRASIPLHLAANGSLEVGHETSIILGGDAAELLVGDTADTLEGVGVPPVRDLLAKLPATRVLIVSGYAEADEIAPDLPRLVKPFRQAELAAIIADGA